MSSRIPRAGARSADVPTGNAGAGSAAAGSAAAGSAAAGGASTLSRVEDYFVGRFTAMASPCELLIDTDDREEASSALRATEGEARRIEQKFSRYRDDNIVHEINTAGGRPIEVDEETARMLDYAAACHEMSGGMFDITSGVLRRAWKFDGSEAVPQTAMIAEALGRMGWDRVRWSRPVLSMPEGMEIDLGGLGKEYAVDRAAARTLEVTRSSFLVNFGGDLFAGAPRRDGRPWVVGVDDPSRTGEGLLYRIDLFRGGLATSGDARRYLMWKGKRLGHILNPKTGWPIEDAPRSVTVLSSTCLEAGTLSTLAYLMGSGAKGFLEEQGVEFRIL